MSALLKITPVALRTATIAADDFHALIDESDIDELATIIDHETGLPGLLAEKKRLREKLHCAIEALEGGARHLAEQILRSIPAESEGL